MKEMTLKDWIEHYHTTDEMRQTFRVQSSALRRTHKYGYYVKDFNLDKIIIGESDAYGQYVLFKEVEKMPLNEESTLMHNNIKTECFLEVGLYSDMLSDVRIQFTPNFLKENFDKFSLFLPEMEFKYYKKVLVYNTMAYLCDYMDKSAQQEVTKLEQELKEGASGSRTFSKSTPQGRAFTEVEQKKTNPFQETSSQAAFVNTFVLPFAIFLLSLMIPILAFIFGHLA